MSHPVWCCKAPVDQTLGDLQMTPRDADRIVVVGGPTRMTHSQQWWWQRRLLDRAIARIGRQLKRAALRSGFWRIDVRRN